MGLFPNLIVTMTIEQWVASMGALDSDASTSEIDPWVVVVAIAYVAPIIPILAVDRIGRRRILILGAIILGEWRRGGRRVGIVSWKGYEMCSY